MEWVKVVIDAYHQGDWCLLILVYGMYITYQRGKDRQACEKSLEAARNKVDQVNARLQEWLLAKSAE